MTTSDPCVYHNHVVKPSESPSLKVEASEFLAAHSRICLRPVHCLYIYLYEEISAMKRKTYNIFPRSVVQRVYIWKSSAKRWRHDQSGFESPFQSSALSAYTYCGNGFMSHNYLDFRLSHWGFYTQCDWPSQAPLLRCEEYAEDDCVFKLGDYEIISMLFCLLHRFQINIRGLMSSLYLVANIFQKGIVQKSSTTFRLSLQYRLPIWGSGLSVCYHKMGAVSIRNRWC